MGYGLYVYLLLAYFLDTQQPDGGWRCEKYSYGHGEETRYSTPYTTLVVLDLFDRFPALRTTRGWTGPRRSCCRTGDIRRPISPCHYGIGSRFLQVEYPMRGYGLFYYVYVLSFYARARADARFRAAFDALSSKTLDGGMPVERVVPRLSALSFCKKGQVSWAGHGPLARNPA